MTVGVLVFGSTPKALLSALAITVGQSIGLIRDIVICQELLEKMVRDADEILANTQRRLRITTS